ncbi:hypothetical protein V8E55_008403 [Tylopilus felleus]
MYVSAAYGPERPRHQSDPGHAYVTPPYTVHWQWPPAAPARQVTNKPTPYPQPPSRSSSVERKGDPQPLLAKYSPSITTPPTSVSPRSPSPQRPGHQRISVHCIWFYTELAPLYCAAQTFPTTDVAI